MSVSTIAFSSISRLLRSGCGWLTTGAAVTTERELAAALADALARPGPTVIDAHVDPAGYPAVMDLSRGQAGRRSVPGISRANQVTQVKERVQ